MDDTISRHGTSAWLEHMGHPNLAKMIMDEKRFPPVIFEPKRGKWIFDGHHVQCDQCGMYMCKTDREGDPIPRSFCPNCGAKMEVTK